MPRSRRRLAGAWIFQACRKHTIHCLPRMAKGDLYQILGVSPTASAAEIKKAHHRLVRKWRPDANKHDLQAEEMTPHPRSTQPRPRGIKFPISLSRPFGPPEEYENSGLTADRGQWRVRHFQGSRIAVTYSSGIIVRSRPVRWRGRTRRSRARNARPMGIETRSSSG